jgi:hypothetical protein
MRTIFLSFHFEEPDLTLARQVESLILSHGLRMQTGEELGGGTLTTEIMNRIAKSDALIALMSERSTEPNTNGTHPWVVDEFKHAKGLGKPAIALVWPAVKVTGAYQDSERVSYEPTNALKSFLKLSQTIGIWKSNAGRTLKLQLLPGSLADKVNQAGGGAQCRYRFSEEGTLGQWLDAPTSIPEGDGTYVYLKGVKEGTSIQMRVELGGQIWESRVIAQSMSVELKQK